MKTFSKLKSRFHYSSIVFQSIFVWFSGSLAILTSLLLPSVANAEGSAQIGLNQPLYEYGYSGSSLLLPIDRPLYVDILSAGEVINVSLCGDADNENVRAVIYNSSGAEVYDTGIVAANISCTNPLNSELTDPFRYVTTAADTYEVRLFNEVGNVLERFDVTVTPNTSTNPDPTEAQGRLHAYSWAFNAGTFAETGSADSDYYTLVPGGRAGQNFVWLLDLNNFAGFVYEIVANNIGVDAPNSGLSTPRSGNSVSALYPIYLGYPDIAGSRPTIPPDIAGFTFTDDEGVDYSISPGSTTGVQDSGTFQFTTDVDGTYAITIDTNENGNFGAGDTLLLGVATPGINTVDWDGRDNEGNILPEGAYDAQLEVRLGEYHFVAGDAETSGGGTNNGLTIYEALNDTTTLDTLVFWDDLTLLGGTTTLPDGALSSTPQGKHTWGNFTGDGFGNQRYIDTYVYGDLTIANTPVAIDAADEPPDYGDAPDSYGDASHITYATPSVYLGSIRPDGETDTQLGTDAGASAAGDDSDGGDDEDAFNTLPNVPSVGNYSLDVPVNTDGDATLHGWVDFDKDGKFEEGEYQSAAVTSTDTTANLTWSVPVGTTPGDSYVRLRLTSDTLNDNTDTSDIDERSTGSASDGEVEDYPVTIEVAPIYDYGDAPDTSTGTGTGDYQTTSTNGGAAQVVIDEVGQVLSLGDDIDIDSGSLQDVDAIADDNDGAPPNDEDGVASFPTLTNTVGQTYTVTVSARNNVPAVPAYLVGFIDFNKDGDFLDEGEQSATVEVASDFDALGTDGKLRDFELTFTTPAGMTPGETFARFRLGQVEATAQQATGASAGTDNGEVEDYKITIEDDGNRPLGLPFTCNSTFYITIGTGGTNPQQLYSVNRSEEPFNLVEIGTNTSTTNGYPTNFSYNALAYNPVDNYLYGMVQESSTDSNATVDPYDQNNVVKIGSDGVVHSLGIPTESDGNPLNDSSYYAATALSDGTYIIGRQNVFAKLDVTTTPPTILDQGTIAGTNFTDFAVDPTDPTSTSGARIYGINQASNTLVILDLTDGSFSVDATATNGTGFSHNTGSQFVDSFGTLYYRSGTNSAEGLYKVDSDPTSPTYGDADFIQSIQTGGNHDGASCLFASVMEKEVRDLEGNTITTIPAGETVNYIYSVASGNVIDLIGVTFEDDLRNVTAGNPINGTFTGNFTVSNGTGTVSFSNDNQTIQISDLTIPAQTQATTDADKVTITAEVKLPRSLTPGDYYNQAVIRNLPSNYPSIIVSDYPPSAAYEDPTPLSVTEPLNPNLLLVKRITAINPGQSDEVPFNTFVDDGTADNEDNDLNWPNDDDIYLPGAISVADIQPGDEIEYTIYFLSNGEQAASNVQICDVIPDNMTFVSNSYGTASGIRLLNSSATSATPTNLSNAADTDEGTFYAPGTAPPTVGSPATNLCKKVDSSGSTVEVDATNNDNGAVVVEIDSLPAATAPGTPANSYGFIRFRAKVQ
ncbi:DUF11 domain-containing protein [Pleurocapsales cyanobacterium LEGE 10410]|nr:DUF11 domain-containing protein [Pleurocapsales cyanobacterium LEGE 10410]